MVGIGKRFQLGVVAGLAILAAGCNNPFVAGLGSSVDLDAPVVRITSPANGSHVRGAITLSGQWNDDKGVTEGRLTITDQNLAQLQGTLPLTINADKTWFVSIDTTAYNDGEKLLAVTVKDDSGRETETRTLLYFDNTPPIATVILPADPAQGVNGLVRFSGEAYDPFGIQQVRVQISATDDFATLLVDAVADGTATWNYEFNSSPYGNSGTETLYYRIRVTDRAGNPSQFFYLYPEVFANNANTQIMIDKIYQILHMGDPNGTLPGHTITKSQLANPPPPASNVRRDFTPLLVDQDSDKPVFTFSTPAFDWDRLGPGAKAVGLVEDDDGFDSNHNFQFEIKPETASFNDADFQPGVITGPTSGLLLRWSFNVPSTPGQYKMRLRIRDKYGKEAISPTRYFYVDVGIPVVEITPPTALYFRNGIDLNLEGTASSAGGEINSIEWSLNGGPWTSVPAGNITGLNTHNTTWEAVIPLSGLSDGPFTVAIRATDNSQPPPKIGSSTLTLRGDVTPPGSAFVFPENDATVYGTVNLRGTTWDNVTVTQVELKIGNAASWIVLTGNPYFWSYPFNADTRANSTDATWDPLENVWLLPIQQRVTDIAGNVYTQTGYQLKIDTDRDKPVVQFIAPPAGANIAGPALVNGTAFDESPGLLRVEMRIAALEGSSGTTIVNGGNGYVDFLGNASPPTTWHVLSGTSVWSVELNSNGRFYNVGKAGMAYPSLPDTGPGAHEGRFLIEVRAVDGNGKVGNVVSRIIRFDDTLPKVTGLNITQYSYIRGTVVFTGTISDDEQINAVQASFDGGVTYHNLVAGTDYTVVDLKTYTLHLSLDTLNDTRIPNSIRTNRNGVMNMRLRVTDNANYQNIIYLDLYVDNVWPSGTFTIVPGVTPDDLNNPPGGRALLRGTASDDGTGITVKDIEKVEVYFTRSTYVLRIADGHQMAYILEDFGNGQGNRPYTDDLAYKIEVLRNHVYAVHFKEIQVDGSNFVWLVGFDSRNIPDGPLTIHYVIHDRAGNRTHGTQAGFIKNNKPVITSVTTGTDLNYSDVVEVAERFTYAGNFNARNRLYLQINATGGNGTLSYAVLEGTTPVPGAPSGTNNSGTVNISSLGDGPRTYTLRVTDVVGIEVEQPFVFTVAQVDNAAPTIQIYAMNQTDSVIPNQGHLEETANNPLNPGVRPAVSGTVRVKGEARDNMRLREIRLTVPGVGTNVLMAEWDTTAKTLVSRNANFVIDTQSLDVTGGHVVFYTYTWNTVSVPNGAGTNVSLTMSAQDYRAGPPPVVTANASFDVVPYITSIVTSLSSAFLSNPSAFGRSARGHYPVRANEVITINGFNLSTAANSVRINAVQLTPTGGNSQSITVNVGATAVSGPIVVRTNGIDSINNSNDNALPQNKEPNNVNNNLLTDDRILSIWDVGSLINNNQLTSPYLKMDNSSAIYLSYGRGSNSMFFWKNGTETLFEQCYNKFHNTFVNFDSSGNYYGAATNTDRINDTVGGATSMTFYSRAPGSQVTGAMAHYTTGTNKRRLELSYNGSTSAYNINRVRIPRFAVRGAGTAGDPARIYMIYYDGNHVDDPIKFRYGTVGGTADTITGAISQNLNNNNPGSSPDFQVVATNASTFRSGLYASIDVTSTGVAVAVWYDATNRRLVYSYNTNPSGASESQWQANATVIDANFAGWFAEIHVDVNNGVHIAYYTSGTGDLKYAYLSSYNAAPQVVTVDSFLSTGTYLSLSTRLESGNVVPYIAYFTPSFVATPNSVRVAYRVNFSSLGHGAVADAYTGNWEVMTIPAINIPQEQYVGLGVPTGGTYANSIYIGYHTDLNYERAFLKR